MQERDVAGITCGAVLTALSDYIDGDASPALRARIEAHLAGCDVCERFGGRFAAAVGALRRRLPEPPLSDAQMRGLALLLDDEERTTRPR